MRNLFMYVGFGVVLLLVTLVVSFTTVDWGLAEDHGEPYWAMNEDSMAWQGQRVITEAGCLQCHSYRGQLGQATGPTLDAVGLRLPEQAIETFIRHGSGVMPAYQDRLSEDEIKLLAEWLSTFDVPYEER
ncbi:c-type cytochrome [Anaerobacillus sp. MEB173]|uniref:c-type cytochrome n=1 Tax=Anaerobacillus sp. MEB173 TaxID=3383345 RepID=UPI003F8F764A